MDSLELAWAAGFIDGEGSIGKTERRGNWPRATTSAERTYFTPRIRAVQVEDRAPLERLRALFGGSIRADRRKTTSGKLVFEWYIGGARAITALEALEPYLSPRKREQARAAIAARRAA